MFKDKSGFRVQQNRVWDFWRSKSGSGVLTVDEMMIMGWGLGLEIRLELYPKTCCEQVRA